MRIKNEHPVKNGWTRWVQPVKRGYLMQCCDCKLIHRVNFRILNGRVQFQMKRGSKFSDKSKSAGKEVTQ